MSSQSLLKQINEKLQQLKESISVFENSLHPDLQQAEFLQQHLQDVNKLVCAYEYVMKQKDGPGILDLHAKVSEKIQDSEPIKVTEIIEEPISKTTEPEKAQAQEIIAEKISVEIEQETFIDAPPPAKEHPKLNINLNDKFRMINELFKSNALEYSIAIEQINTTTSWPDTQMYLNGLKNIYSWDENNEMVKKLYSFSQKRFD